MAIPLCHLICINQWACHQKDTFHPEKCSGSSPPSGAVANLETGMFQCRQVRGDP